MLRRLLAIGVAGCTADVVEPGVVSLEPTSSTNAPLSYNDDIALVADDVACAIDSFESRVLCRDWRGGVVGVFGREGDGPGEFRGLSGVERGPDGLLAAFDLELARLTFFKPDGTRSSEVPMPAGFYAQELQSGQVLGLRVSFSNRDRAAGLPPFVPMSVDASSGQQLWERSDIAEAADRECLTAFIGTADPAGGLVYLACEHELAFFDQPDAESATVVPSPAYTGELPNERDVDAYVDGISRIGGGVVTPPESVKEAYAAGFREEPKSWFLRPFPFKFDGASRLWVATTRDRDTYSYFDIWIGTQYAGAVRIRDRLLGYDLLGSVLVALVERKPGRDGIAQRAIDWYDISEVEFGS